MIKEIIHLVGLSEKQYLQDLLNNIQEMQKKGLEVEVQYGVGNELTFTALIIGRTKGINSKVK